MRPLAEAEIRACFINCSKGEAQRMNLPRDLAETPWPDLDFLGWRDPGAPDRAYLVTERPTATAAGTPKLIGISLRTAAANGRSFTARSICSLCKTTRTGGGVALLTARRPGESGRNGNTIGQYICSDLACSLYVRGKKISAGTLLDETLDHPAQIARLEKALDAFLAKLTAPTT